MAVTNLSYGSSGEDVKKLQTALNSALGTSLEVDGQFGKNTLAAVKQYQQANGLTVDGIAGKNTQSALYATPTTSTTSTTTTTTPSTTTGSTSSSTLSTRAITGVSEGTAAKIKELEQGYTASPTVQAAEAYLESVSKNKPGAFESEWQSKVDDLYNQIVNRPDFEYDVANDMLYQQYKDQYTQSGRRAMEDTLAQAAALTGGYNSTYAQTAGQQTYDEYLRQVNDMIPDLYSAAYNRYQAEGDELTNAYSMAADMYNDEYNKYRDTYGDWENEYSRAYEDYWNKYNTDYGQYSDDLTYWTNKADMESDDYWKVYEAELAAQAAASSGSGGSGGSGKDYDYQEEYKLGDMKANLANLKEAYNNASDATKARAGYKATLDRWLKAGSINPREYAYLVDEMNSWIAGGNTKHVNDIKGSVVGGTPSDSAYGSYVTDVANATLKKRQAAETNKKLKTNTYNSTNEYEQYLTQLEKDKKYKK